MVACGAALLIPGIGQVASLAIAAAFVGASVDRLVAEGMEHYYNCS
jgi:hypothetical protein